MQVAEQLPQHPGQEQRQRELQEQSQAMSECLGVHKNHWSAAGSTSQSREI